MLSIVIPTHESERALVPTLACLVPGATAGLVREVLLADAGSADQTQVVGEIAGCVFLLGSGPLGARLRHAADVARGPWLMFLQPGAVLDTGWEQEVAQWIARGPAQAAAVFTRPLPLAYGGSLWGDLIGLWRSRQSLLRGDRGLLIRKDIYAAMGGHSAGADAEGALLRRIGRQRLAVLRTGIMQAEAMI